MFIIFVRKNNFNKKIVFKTENQKERFMNVKKEIGSIKNKRVEKYLQGWRQIILFLILL